MRYSIAMFFILILSPMGSVAGELVSADSSDEYSILEELSLIHI